MAIARRAEQRIALHVVVAQVAMADTAATADMSRPRTNLPTPRREVVGAAAVGPAEA